ncbi:hypothetical protein ACLOJK_024661 [Asimina triloba]
MISVMPRYPRSYGGGEPGCSLPRFRPYVAKVPWHSGARGLLSQLFPRYGHYCGPNWSSGKDNGLPLWDKRPIDWLDFCCYCHDIGYDTHDQERLLKADLAFLECLERPRTSKTKGDPRIALLYQSMCITGTFAVCEPLMRWSNDVMIEAWSEDYTYTLQNAPCETTIRAFSGRLDRQLEWKK